MASLVKPWVTWFYFENVDIFVGHEHCRTKTSFIYIVEIIETSYIVFFSTIIINVNKGVFCLIISYLQIKSYNVLNYNNCSTDWPFPLIYLHFISMRWRHSITLPNIVPFWLCFNIKSTAIQCLQLYIVLIIFLIFLVLTYFMRTHAFFFFVANAIVLSRVFRGHWSMCWQG
jgi:hypothetical protein